MTTFSTGLQGQLDNTENINLDPATSASNTDQTGYAVTWRWGFTPVSYWNVSQDNSAGAQVTTYPPDVKYVDALLAAQRVARDGDAGLWAPTPLP